MTDLFRLDRAAPWIFMTTAEVPELSTRRPVDHLRAFGLVVSAALVVAALYPFPDSAVARTEQWWLLLGALVVAALAQTGVRIGVTAGAPPAPVGWMRKLGGFAIALAGAGVWAWATREFYLDWTRKFDTGWLGWVAGTALLGVGLDMATGNWDDAAALRRSGKLWLAMAVVLLCAGAVRLMDISTFPGPAGITQIEDLQFGNWGAHFLAGQRRRWEFIGHAWVSALGIKLGGPNLNAMRTAYAVVGTLTVGAVFLWLRSTAGWIAAIAGAAFMVVSSWDAVVARIGFNPNVLTVAVIYWLMMGPGRRGRPSAYAAMGLICGYVLWEYIAYRPAVVFGLLGGVFFSIRDRSSGWGLRLGRPALMIALIVCMSIPLFGARLKGRVANEYLNGLNRARAEKSYYNDEHSWDKTLELRKGRAFRTVGLFFFQGEGNATRNVGYRPLADPVTAFLGLVGFAYCLANALVPLFGMFAAAFVATTIGAMVVTSDFNALRMSVTIPYVYFFVGLGAFGIYRVWERAWRGWGRGLATAALLAGLVWAVQSNLGFLHDYHNSPTTRRAVHSALARMCSWLGDNVASGEQVIGAAHRNNHALIGSDAAWLRGGRIPGAMEWDITTALEKWTEDRPTVLVVYTGADTMPTARFLEDVIPGLEMEVDADDLVPDSTIAFGRLAGRPARLDPILEELRCKGVSVRYVYRGDGTEVLKTVERVAPFVGLSTWPSEVVHWFHRGVRPRRLEVYYEADLLIEQGGEYQFESDFYGGTARMAVDGNPLAPPRSLRVRLEPGRHRFRAVADLAPLGGGLKARILWRGPDSGGVRELLPFYRVAEPVPGCKSAVSLNQLAG